jgi:hypothetical protein
VTRGRYVLMSSARIFADPVPVSDALGLAIHLSREATHPLFTKVGADRKHVTHVAKVRNEAEFEALKPLLLEAYDFSIT